MKATEILQQEHRTIERVSRACDVFAEMLQNGTKVPASVLQSVIKFLRAFCHDYHQEQEAWFFAMLQMKGFQPEEFPIESLRHEHDKVGLLTNRLANAVDRYSLSDSMADTTLISTLRALAELYSDHLWKENYVLLLIAEELFSATDQRVLTDTLQVVRVAKGVVRDTRSSNSATVSGSAPNAGDRSPASPKVHPIPRVVIERID